MDDGGPAFPTTAINEGYRADCTGPGYPCSTGASLLDLFAMHADPKDVWGPDGIPASVAEELLRRPCPAPAHDRLGYTIWWTEALARWKYTYATLMVAEKRRRENTNARTNDATDKPPQEPPTVRD